MNTSQEIQSVRDIVRVAKQLFPCAAKKIVGEYHGQGYLGVKLIVGKKPNIAYDHNANPNLPNLAPEQRQLAFNQSKQWMADVRNLWVRAGTTTQELIDNYLMGIKKSIANKTPIVAIKPEVAPINEISDDDLAEQLEKGETPEVEVEAEEAEEFGLDEDLEDGGFEPQPLSKIEKVGSGDKESNQLERIIEGMEMIGKNMETLAGDVGKVVESQDKMEQRLYEIENGGKSEPKKKIGRPAKE